MRTRRGNIVGNGEVTGDIVCLAGEGRWSDVFRGRTASTGSQLFVISDLDGKAVSFGRLVKTPEPMRGQLQFQTETFHDRRLQLSINWCSVVERSVASYVCVHASMDAFGFHGGVAFGDDAGCLCVGHCTNYAKRRSLFVEGESIACPTFRGLEPPD